MNKELIEPYVNRRIKLVLNGNFCLTGKINKLYDDSFTFTTRQKTSLIHIERVREISPID